MATVTISDGSQVTATDHHLFWVDNDQAWIELDQVETGDELLTPTGTVKVTSVMVAPVAETLVWELTVADDHNFTVHTSTTDLLVHNVDPEDCAAVFDELGRPISGAGGSLDNISPADARRIQNAANRIGHPISVVGSRASGTAGPLSDWDYVIAGINSRTRHSVSSSLPSGHSGLGQPRNLDIFTGQVADGLPFVTFYPQG